MAEEKNCKAPWELLQENTYPGRGILIGKTANGRCAVSGYFIMGRSANSRNRVFAVRGGEVFTQAARPELVEDPSLIIYAAVRSYENCLVVTNGDQTDTIVQTLQAGGSFAQALTQRCFEPDAPHFTPRISGILHLQQDDFYYEMSILKSADASGSACDRFLFSYPALCGRGHLLHTYQADGNPLPSFTGEPRCVRIDDDIDAFTAHLWQGLHGANRISLYVRYTDLQTKKYTDRVINQYEGACEKCRNTH